MPVEPKYRLTLPEKHPDPSTYDTSAPADDTWRHKHPAQWAKLEPVLGTDIAGDIVKIEENDGTSREETRWDHHAHVLGHEDLLPLSRDFWLLDDGLVWTGTEVLTMVDLVGRFYHQPRFEDDTLCTWDLEIHHRAAFVGAMSHAAANLTLADDDRLPETTMIVTEPGKELREIAGSVEQTDKLPEAADDGTPDVATITTLPDEIRTMFEGEGLLTLGAIARANRDVIAGLPGMQPGIMLSLDQALEAAGLELKDPLDIPDFLKREPKPPEAAVLRKTEVDEEEVVYSGRLAECKARLERTPFPEEYRIVSDPDSLVMLGLVKEAAEAPAAASEGAAQSDDGTEGPSTAPEDTTAAETPATNPEDLL